MKSAMVLAAGLGTRLRPLTLELPKALVPVGDRPLIEHVSRAIRVSGWDRIVVNAFHHADLVEAWATTSDVLVSRETELLGTAGGVALARPLLGGGEVLVYNADILADLDLDSLALGGVATLAVAPRPRGEGSVGIDDEGRIVRLRTHAVRAEARGGDFLGVHMLSRALVATLPEQGCLVADVYIPALERGEVIRAFDVHEPFVDVGTLRSYFDANMAWLDQRGTSWSHESARMASGVSLNRSILGQGARAEGAGMLTDCVVWPGAVARAPLARAVVTRTGIVPA